MILLTDEEIRVVDNALCSVALSESEIKRVVIRVGKRR